MYVFLIHKLLFGIVDVNKLFIQSHNIVYSKPCYYLSKIILLFIRAIFCTINITLINDPKNAIRVNTDLYHNSRH